MLEKKGKKEQKELLAGNVLIFGKYVFQQFYSL